jgi:hypothetical protein
MDDGLTFRLAGMGVKIGRLLNGTGVQCGGAAGDDGTQRTRCVRCARWR